MFLIEFEGVLRILSDALDEFPSDVPWAAQYVFERRSGALSVVFGLAPGTKLQHAVLIKVCIVLNLIGLLRSHIIGLCTLGTSNVMEPQRRLRWRIV